MSRPSSMTSVRCVGTPSSSKACDPQPLGRDAVVVGAHDGRRDDLAHLAGVDAGALGDGVGLEAVAAGLVEQHAAEPVGHDDRHGADGSRLGVQHDDAPSAAAAARGARGDASSSELEPGAAADRLVARLDDVAAARHHLDGETRARAVVAHEFAERVDDEHLLAPSP